MVFPLGKMTFVPHFAELRASRSSIILTRACSLRVVPLLIASVVWVVFEKWDHRGTQGIHIKWSSRNRNMTIKHQIRNHDESWFYVILIMYMYGFKIYNKCLGAIQKMPSIEMGRPANEIDQQNRSMGISIYSDCIYSTWVFLFIIVRHWQPQPSLQFRSKSPSAEQLRVHPNEYMIWRLKPRLLGLIHP